MGSEMCIRDRDDHDHDPATSGDGGCQGTGGSRRTLGSRADGPGCGLGGHSGRSCRHAGGLGRLLGAVYGGLLGGLSCPLCRFHGFPRNVLCSLYALGSSFSWRPTSGSFLDPRRSQSGIFAARTPRCRGRGAFLTVPTTLLGRYDGASLLTSPDLSAMLRSPDRQRTLLSLSQVLLAINRHLCSWVLPLHIGGLGFDRFLPSLRRRGAALGAVSDAFVMSRRTSAIRVPCAALGTVCRLLGLSIPSSAFQQIPATALHLPGGASGGVLDLIPSIPILLVPLGGIPELEAQSLRTILQSPVDELLGGRFDFLFQALSACMLLLDLLDALSPPVWRGPRRPPPNAPNAHHPPTTQRGGEKKRFK